MATHFFGFFSSSIRILPVSTELRWRFPGQSLEHAIELRERLESRGERNLADPYIAVMQ
jgi:hypothetical protein